jgi:serine/threonine-protein kinase RsbW
VEFTDEPLAPIGQTLLQMPVESRLGYKTPLVFRIIKLLRQSGYLPDYGCHMAEVCLEEALANAMVHGNKLDKNRQVRVTVFGDDEQFGLIIEDEGDGFGPQDVPNPNDPENLLRERGRGIMLMNHYMDRVQYLRPGNRLRMMRHRQTAPDEGALPPAQLPDAEPVPADGTIETVAIEPVEYIREPSESVTIPDTIELEGQAHAPAETMGPVTISRQDDIVIAAVTEPRIAEETAAAVSEALAAVAEQADHLVLDLAAVEFVASAGIGAMLIAYKQMTKKKGQFVIASLQPGVMSVLKASGLTGLLQTQPDREAAIAKVQSARQ